MFSRFSKATVFGALLLAALPAMARGDSNTITGAAVLSKTAVLAGETVTFSVNATVAFSPTGSRTANYYLFMETGSTCSSAPLGDRLVSDFETAQTLAISQSGEIETERLEVGTYSLCSYFKSGNTVAFTSAVAPVVLTVSKNPAAVALRVNKKVRRFGKKVKVTVEGRSQAARTLYVVAKRGKSRSKCAKAFNLETADVQRNNRVYLDGNFIANATLQGNFGVIYRELNKTAKIGETSRIFESSGKYVICAWIQRDKSLSPLAADAVGAKVITIKRR